MIRATPLPNALRFEAVQRRLFGLRNIPFSEWGSLPGLSRRALARLRSLVGAHQAVATADAVEIPHAIVASFDSALQRELGLPELADVALKVGLHRTIDQPDAVLVMEWLERGQRPVVPRRVGLIAEIGGVNHRLSHKLYTTVETAEAFNATQGLPVDQRLSAWLPFQEAIASATGGAVKAEGQAGSLFLYQAGSFGLDIEERPDGLNCEPRLMSRRQAVSLEDDAPLDLFEEGRADPGLAESLLSREQRSAFKTEFDRGGATHAAYKLSRNSYVLLDPDLRVALDVVQRMRRAPDGERRAFARNPRSAIAKALAADDPDALASVLFVETHGYSERVEGLGLWEKPKLPWLTRRPNDWLPERVPISIGGERRELTRDEAVQVVSDIAAAEADQASEVQVLDQYLTLDEARKIREQIEGFGAAPPLGDQNAAGGLSEAAGQFNYKREGPEAENSAKLVLRLKPNYEEPEYVASFSPRRALIEPSDVSPLLASTFKAHQAEGFNWLVAAWRAGWPGVLLADDMGLGKTFQSLAFMAWLRENQKRAAERGIGGIAAGPLLVVAPIALLENWKREVDMHLHRPGLGSCLAAYGPGLRVLKDSAGRIDPSALENADWLLTTYETLAGAHTSFGRVRFALALFDEVQKIKDPTTINAHAAKTVNADFMLGMTGTPIENGLSDIWSITDALVPGYLGDLRTFASTYDDDRPDSLEALKAKLETGPKDAPPILLRRMKEDVLDGLPRKVVRSHVGTMPLAQAEAYSALVERARAEGAPTPGAKLKLIHAMRGVSLHPDGLGGPESRETAAIERWIGRSARLRTTVDILNQIAQRGEKALVFIESLEMQDAFADAAPLLFDVNRPAIINGNTPGRQRQSIVDRFQTAPPGFDLLLLSPKAAGVGLTITAANHVVHLSRWWNPAVEDQCNDRAFRIGQMRDVTVHLPLAVHPRLGEASFDLILDRLLARKRTLSRTMLAPPSSANDIDAVIKEAVSPQSAA